MLYFVGKNSASPLNIHVTMGKMTSLCSMFLSQEMEKMLLLSCGSYETNELVFVKHLK